MAARDVESLQLEAAAAMLQVTQCRFNMTVGWCGGGAPVISSTPHTTPAGTCTYMHWPKHRCSWQLWILEINCVDSDSQSLSD